MSENTVAHKIDEKKRTDDVIISDKVDFAGLLLSESVLQGLKSSGFERPSPIQLKAIPLGRCGLDLIVQAKSGTGKTCVFSVISLESLQTDSCALQVLVLAPTREIAIQIWDVIRSVGKFVTDLSCQTFIGGMPLQEDKQKLKNCQIAVGTPGRIKQLIETRTMLTDSIRMFVLDEADKLLEEGFQEQINWIYSTLPDNKQMLALSATYPEYLAQHLIAYMRNPTFLRLNITDPALLGIRQFYRVVPYHPLPHKLMENKTKLIVELLSSVTFQQCLVFSNLQTRAQNIAEVLTNLGWPTACIAGSYDQKDRNEAMSKLKTYKCRVLISTDLTARGIDANRVDMVINLDVPKDHETYLHRIGRAGRFGTFGAAVSVVSEGKEEEELRSVEQRCNTQILPLPDPIPQNLPKSECRITLDDVVSTKQIITTPSDKQSVLRKGKHTKFSKSKKEMNCNSQANENLANGENVSIQKGPNVESEVTRSSDKGPKDESVERKDDTPLQADVKLIGEDIKSLHITHSSQKENSCNIGDSCGKKVNLDIEENASLQDNTYYSSCSASAVEKIKFPSFKEAIGYVPIHVPHTIKSAQTEIDQNSMGELKALKIGIPPLHCVNESKEKTLSDIKEFLKHSALSRIQEKIYMKGLQKDNKRSDQGQIKTNTECTDVTNGDDVDIETPAIIGKTAVCTTSTDSEIPKQNVARKNKNTQTQYIKDDEIETCMSRYRESQEISEGGIHSNSSFYQTRSKVKPGIDNELVRSETDQDEDESKLDSFMTEFVHGIIRSQIQREEDEDERITDTSESDEDSSSISSDEDSLSGHEDLNEEYEDQYEEEVGYLEEDDDSNDNVEDYNDRNSYNEEMFDSSGYGTLPNTWDSFSYINPSQQSSYQQFSQPLYPPFPGYHHGYSPYWGQGYPMGYNWDPHSYHLYCQYYNSFMQQNLQKAMINQQKYIKFMMQNT